jgi:predicted aldo/keto reductase-like oxidoreductase
MTRNRIYAFVEYVLAGAYKNRKDKPKVLMTISRNSLTRVLGGQRLGSAQKEELRKICRTEGIALAELGDRFIFFDPDDVKRLCSQMTREKQLKDATDYFSRLQPGAADEEWEKYDFRKIG